MENSKKTDISKYCFGGWGMRGEREDNMGEASRIWKNRSSRKGTQRRAWRQTGWWEAK